MDRCRELGARLVEEGTAYEDEGAIRFRMPDEGVTAWDDAVRGRIEFPNEQLEDVVLVRSDGRPTYNFASPVEDMDDAISHVIRGDDHISNTPKQIQILQALGHEPPVYAHVANILGTDGKKLSKRHGAVVGRRVPHGRLPPGGDRQLPRADRLGARRRDDDHVARRDRRALHARGVSVSPGTFDYAKLDWMNGVYLRALAPDGLRRPPRPWVGEQGLDWPAERVHDAARRSCRRRSARLDEFPGLRRVPVPRRRAGSRRCSTRAILARGRATRSARSSRGRPTRSRRALKQLCEELGEKPRTVYGPIRVAVTGSKVSPGLYESLELLGREATLERIAARSVEVAAA